MFEIEVACRVIMTPGLASILFFQQQVFCQIFHIRILLFSDFNKLMLVAECIVSLLLPFSWAHVYVPILPSPLHHFLDAPVPFVMGEYLLLLLLIIRIK